LLPVWGCNNGPYCGQGWQAASLHQVCSLFFTQVPVPQCRIQKTLQEFDFLVLASVESSLLYDYGQN